MNLDESIEAERRALEARNSMTSDTASPELEGWRICDELTVRQAVLLHIGVSPSSELGAYCHNYQPHERPRNYDATFHAFTSAILSGRMAARLRYRTRQRDFDEFPGSGEVFAQREVFNPPAAEVQFDERQPLFLGGAVDVIILAQPDWDMTTVDVDEVATWLHIRGLPSAFFRLRARPVRSMAGQAAYMDETHQRYAPKLAAAVAAWEAYEPIPSRTPKQVIRAWLLANAKQFGLADAKGTAINQSIEDVAKVANWQRDGGAPATGPR